MSVPAVVGSWPEPFAQASSDPADRVSVRVECAAPRPACRTVADRLRRGGRPTRGGAARLATGLRAGGGRSASWSGPGRALRGQPAASLRGPATSGVFATFKRRGTWPVRARRSRTRRASRDVATARARGLWRPWRHREGRVDLARHRHRRRRRAACGGRPRRRRTFATATRSRRLRTRLLWAFRLPLPMARAIHARAAPDEVAARLRAPAHPPGRRERACAATVYLGSFVVAAFAYSEPDRPRGGGGRDGRRRGLAARRTRALRRLGALGPDAGGVHRRGQRARRRSAATPSSSTACGCRCSAASDVSAEALADGGRAGASDRRRADGVRRSLRVRRSRSGAAPAAAPGPPLGADRDPDRAARAARRRPTTCGSARPPPCAARAPPRSGGRLWRDGSSPARSTGRSTSPRRSSCAATRRPTPHGRAAFAARATIAAFVGRRDRDRRGGARAPASPGSGPSTPIRSSAIDSGPASAGAGGVRCRSRAAVPFLAEARRRRG